LRQQYAAPAACAQAVGVDCAIFADLGAMLTETRPETLVVHARQRA
jgi:hypothetical protein